MTAMIHKQQYRFVKQFGTIKRGRKNDYVFNRFPDSDSPVIKLTHKSQWGVVEQVYHLINELKSE